MDLISHVHLWALLGVLLSPIVGLVTKEETKSGIQGALMTGLAAVLGVVVEGVQAEQNGTGFAWKVALGTAVIAWIVAQVAHSAVWSPTGIAKFLQRLGLPEREAEAVAGWAVGESTAVLAEIEAASNGASVTGQPVAPAPGDVAKASA